MLIPPVYILTTMLFTELHVAGSRVRRDQRHGRHRRRSRAADRRSHHHGDQLAGSLHLPGADHRGDRLVEPQRSSTPCRPTRRDRSTHAARVLSAVGLVLVVTGILAADNNLWLMVDLDRRRRVVPASGSSCTCARKERAGKEPLLSTQPVPQPHLEPRARDPEHPVATAHGHVIRGLGLPAGRSRLQRDPDRRHLHRRTGGDTGLLARRGAAR